MLSRFHLIPERYGQRDRRTDRQICYISMLMRDKNRHKCHRRRTSRSRSGIAKKLVPRTETMLVKEASDTCIWKYTCHGPCQRTHYAGVSTDKCTIRVTFLH